MGDEGDPVPGRHVALVVVERLGDRPRSVVETEEPEDADEELADLRVLVEPGALEVAADGVRADVEVRWVLLEHAILVLAPLGPRFREANVHRDGEVERLGGVLVELELGEEHRLEREELGLLDGVEVEEVGVVDDVESAGDLGETAVVALGLLAKLEERLLDLDVGERVDLGEGGDADLVEAVLSSDVGEAVDDPGRLVVPAVGERARVAAGAAASRDEREVRLVDRREDVLPPGDEVAPDVDVVPEVGKAVAPRRKDALELLGPNVEVGRTGRGETGEDLLRLLEFDELLEDLEEGDVGLRDDLGEVIPLAQRKLDPLVAELLEDLLRVVRRVRRLRREEREVRLEDPLARRRHGAHRVEGAFDHLAVDGPVGEPPSAFEEEFLVAFVASETARRSSVSFLSETIVEAQKLTRRGRPT